MRSADSYVVSEGRDGEPERVEARKGTAETLPDPDSSERARGRAGGAKR